MKIVFFDFVLKWRGVDAEFLRLLKNLKSFSCSEKYIDQSWSVSILKYFVLHVFNILLFSLQTLYINEKKYFKREKFY